MRYKLNIVWSKEGHSFLGKIPKIPSGIVDGTSYDVANVLAVSDEWTETAGSLKRPIREPKGKLAYA